MGRLNRPMNPRGQPSNRQRTTHCGGRHREYFKKGNREIRSQIAGLEKNDLENLDVDFSKFLPPGRQNPQFLIVDSTST